MDARQDRYKSWFVLQIVYDELRSYGIKCLYLEIGYILDKPINVLGSGIP